MASRKTKKTTKKRAHRATSNVFAMFDQNQIQEFKEAFNMIDQNSDGFVDKEDLHDMLASLGKDPTDEYLEEMVKMSPGPINFTMFLTLFGEKLNGTDPEDVINNAFACFDDDGNGKVHEDALKEALTTMGDRFTEDQVDDVLRDAPIDKDGYLDFVKFTHILKHGKKDDNDWDYRQFPWKYFRFVKKIFEGMFFLLKFVIYKIMKRRSNVWYIS